MASSVSLTCLRQWLNFCGRLKQCCFASLNSLSALTSSLLRQSIKIDAHSNKGLTMGLYACFLIFGQWTFNASCVEPESFGCWADMFDHFPLLCSHSKASITWTLSSWALMTTWSWSMHLKVTGFLFFCVWPAQTSVHQGGLACPVFQKFLIPNRMDTP